MHTNPSDIWVSHRNLGPVSTCLNYFNILWNKSGHRKYQFKKQPGFWKLYRGSNSTFPTNVFHTEQASVVLLKMLNLTKRCDKLFFYRKTPNLQCSCLQCMRLNTHAKPHLRKDEIPFPERISLMSYSVESEPVPEVCQCQLKLALEIKPRWGRGWVVFPVDSEAVGHLSPCRVHPETVPDNRVIRMCAYPGAPSPGDHTWTTSTSND